VTKKGGSEVPFILEHKNEKKHLSGKQLGGSASLDLGQTGVIATIREDLPFSGSKKKKRGP